MLTGYSLKVSLSILSLIGRVQHTIGFCISDIKKFRFGGKAGFENYTKCKILIEENRPIDKPIETITNWLISMYLLMVLYGA